MEKINEIKKDIQLDCADTWVSKNLCGTFELATGVGKTFASFECLCSFADQYFGEETGKLKVLILAEVTERENTFFEDLAKFERLNSVSLRDAFDFTFACYQSAYKWTDTYWDVVIADEIHDSLTEQYHKFYENNTWKGIIGLSATIDRKAPVGEEEDGLTKGHLIDKVCPVIYTITQDEAISKGLIAPYEVVVLYNTLDDKDKIVKGGTKAKPFMTTEKSAYNFLDERFKKSFFITNAKAKKNQIQIWSRKRASILWNLPSKNSQIKQILNNSTRRQIVFANSLDALEEMEVTTVSSRNTKLQNEKILSDFNSGQMNTIGSFKKLKQGANLSNISMAIIHSYYSKTKDYIQRVGRVLRLDGSKKALVVVIVTVGTQEEKWFDKMMENVTVPHIAFRKPEDLINYINK